MYRYIITRVLMTIPTLIGAAVLVFVLMRLIPGDICVVRLGSGGGSFSEHSVQMCHAELGIDRPMLVHPQSRQLDVVRQTRHPGDRDPPADLD